MSKPRLRIDWSTLAVLRSQGLEDLAVLHWEEAEIHLQDVPLALDFEWAAAAEQAGQYKLCGLWVDGDLVGYAAFTVMTAMFHRTTLHAFCSAIYVDPDHRGLASYYLLRWCPAALAALGVKKVYMASKPHVHLKNDRATLGTILNGLGWTLSEEVYCLLLGDHHGKQHPRSAALPPAG